MSSVSPLNVSAIKCRYKAVAVAGLLLSRDRICKRLRSPGIDSNESIPPAYVSWWAGTSNKVIVPALQTGIDS